MWVGKKNREGNSKKKYYFSEHSSRGFLRRRDQHQFVRNSFLDRKRSPIPSINSPPETTPQAGTTLQHSRKLTQGETNKNSFLCNKLKWLTKGFNKFLKKKVEHQFSFLWKFSLSFHVSQFLLSTTGIFITLYLRGVCWKCSQIHVSEPLRKVWCTILSTEAKSMRKLIIPPSVHVLIIWNK